MIDTPTTDPRVIETLVVTFNGHAFEAWRFDNGTTIIDLRLFPVGALRTREQDLAFFPDRLEAMGVPGWAIASAMTSSPSGFAACKGPGTAR